MSTWHTLGMSLKGIFTAGRVRNICSDKNMMIQRSLPPKSHTAATRLNQSPWLLLNWAGEFSKRCIIWIVRKSWKKPQSGKKALLLDNSIISMRPCMCSCFCNFTFLLANNFHIPNTALEMKLNGVEEKEWGISWTKQKQAKIMPNVFS